MACHIVMRFIVFYLVVSYIFALNQIGVSMYRADYENVVVCDQLRTRIDICGSASYVINQDSLIVKKPSPRDNYELEIKKPDPDRIMKSIGMNKKKVRSKIMAYSQLPASKKFLAFYSISFPVGLSDKAIKKIHNTVLTRIRKLRKSFSYIWVAELQKNGTMHFHMITNSYFSIRIINSYYGTAIHNYLFKSIENIKFLRSSYNGVDVKQIRNHKTVAIYMTKYVTKNETKMEGLSWNCSSDVSALFTSLQMSHAEFIILAKRLIYVDSFKVATADNMKDLEFDLYSYNGNVPKMVLSALFKINTHIMRRYFDGINLTK